VTINTTLENAALTLTYYLWDYGYRLSNQHRLMFDDRTNLAQQVSDELKKYFGDKLCTTTIPRNIRLAEAPSHGKPALLYDVRSRGAESYIRLAKELLERYAAGRDAAAGAA
jgi:cellulose biosynthesis protein BcsQ